MNIQSFRCLPQFRMEITFTDGTSGIADFSELIKYRPFNKLREESGNFTSVYPDFNGSLIWLPFEIPIPIEVLYAMVHSLPFSAKEVAFKAHKEYIKNSIKEYTIITALIPWGIICCIVGFLFFRKELEDDASGDGGLALLALPIIIPKLGIEFLKRKIIKR